MINDIHIGMGVTICYYSDRVPATIIKLSPNKNKFYLQEDISIRTDNNGMSEIQEYIYSPNPNGIIREASKRKDGTYRLVKEKTIVSIGSRRKYHDYSF